MTTLKGRHGGLGRGCLALTAKPREDRGDHPNGIALVRACPQRNPGKGDDQVRSAFVALCGVAFVLCFGVSAPAGTEILVLQPGPEEGKDTYICDCSPDENNPNGPITHLYQGQYGSCYDRTLIEWNLSALPANATIESAMMELWFNQLWGSESGEMVYYPILEYWEETEVTYSAQPAYSHDDSVVTAWPQQNNSWHGVDVTEFVRMWHDGTYENYGIYCHCQNTVSTSCAEFNSSDVATEDRRPRLTIEYTGQMSGDPEGMGALSRLELRQNYPNPFVRRTRIRYSLDRHCPVHVDVFDALGRRVTGLVSTNAGPGEHEVAWDASDVPSGVYVIRLRAGDREIGTRATHTQDQ
jgi:hypothetical protein